MKKSKLDQRYSPYQMPGVIIGTIVEEKPNFMLCTWVSRVNRNPPIWMTSINKKHYTMEGIHKNKIFSMNFPSSNLVKEADYIGTTSGRERDKSSLFNIFYGQTQAPMIEECPINIEFTVESIIEYPDHYIVLGTAINTYATEQYLSDGIPAMKKINPLIYTGAEKQPTYWSIGEKIGDAFKIGKGFKQ
ncbi:MAG: flavin reductase family protein [Asgard group archaeon]|nr:flavin reductase family protein [Asgard group archaeon]